jgi:hypothetical protein
LAKFVSKTVSDRRVITVLALTYLGGVTKIEMILCFAPPKEAKASNAGFIALNFASVSTALHSGYFYWERGKCQTFISSLSRLKIPERTFSTEVFCLWHFAEKMKMNRPLKRSNCCYISLCWNAVAEPSRLFFRKKLFFKAVPEIFI